jgi:hypothetical protein
MVSGLLVYRFRNFLSSWNLFYGCTILKNFSGFEKTTFSRPRYLELDGGLLSLVFLQQKSKSLKKINFVYLSAGPRSSFLRKVDLEIVNSTQCSEKQVCTFALGKDLCTFDSGRVS